MSSLRKSFLLTLAQNYSSLVLNFISAILLARLLTPQEIGIYAVPAAFVLIAHGLRDFGLSDYIVQEGELAEQRLRTVLGLSLLFSWALAGLLYIFSGPLAAFYGDAAVQQVLQVMSVNFLLLPLATPAYALLLREMRFGALYVVHVASSATRLIVGVSMALAGHGYMSPAYAELAAVVVVLLTTTAFNPVYARLRPSLKEWRRLIDFGAPHMTAVTVRLLGNNIPEIVVGRVLGFQAAGIFSRSQGFAKLFDELVMRSTHQLALPHFADEKRAGVKLRAGFLRAIGLITAASWPASAFIAIMAYPMINIFYGDQWDAAVPIARILLLAVAIDTLTSLARSLLVALGAVRTQLRAVLGINAIRVLLIVAAAPFGLDAVAVAIVAAVLFGVAVHLHYLRRVIDLDPTAYLPIVSNASLLALAAALVPLLVLATMTVDAQHLWAPTFVAAIGSGIGWLGMLRILRHPLLEELQILASRAFGKD